MNTSKHWGAIFALPLFLVLMAGCKSEPKEKPNTEEESQAVKRPVVEVVTKSMEFFAPDTIPSGWNTFVYKNESTEPHFILLDKYPEGVTIEDGASEVGPAFDEGMAFIMEGKMAEAMEAFGKLPEWFSEVVFSGGTGLISPNKTAVTTAKLEPGYYVMECYVRMPDGQFHNAMGMAKELIVTEEVSEVNPPDASVAISVSSDGGITWTGTPAPGMNVFSVTYTDQIVHENFVGHDLNLVHMEEGADLKALEGWINWATPTGLMSSTAPEGFTFLGGTNDAPAGSVLYFEAKLEAGNYAFIAEVPNAGEKGMIKSFTIGE